MSKKTFFTAFVLVVCVLIASGASSVGAQGPLAHGATYLDNQWRWIGPDATLWYAFEYAGDRTVVLLTLVNGVELGMQFNVYAPDKPSDQPIGRGTSSQIICSNGDKCQSPDLVWKGGTSSGGTYYVQVINKTSVAKSFLLTSTYGSGVATTTTPNTVYVTPYVYVQPYTPPVSVQPYTPPVYVQPYVAPTYPQQPYNQYYYPYNYAPPNTRYTKSPYNYWYYPPQYGYPYYR